VADNFVHNYFSLMGVNFRRSIANTFHVWKAQGLTGGRPRPDLPPLTWTARSDNWITHAITQGTSPRRGQSIWRCGHAHHTALPETRYRAMLSLPKTPSGLKMQRFRAFMRSCCYHDDLTFRRFFVAGRLQLSNPCCAADGDPRASSPTHRSPKERAASFAPPALRSAFVGFALAMVDRLAPESTHRSPRYSDRLAP
jgi:hypothetical protein